MTVISDNSLQPNSFGHDASHKHRQLTLLHACVTLVMVIKLQLVRQ